MEKRKGFNGKVVCVEAYWTPNLTKGKIYEVKDGFIIDDAGYTRPRVAWLGEVPARSVKELGYLLGSDGIFEEVIE